MWCSKNLLQILYYIAHQVRICLVLRLWMSSSKRQGWLRSQMWKYSGTERMLGPIDCQSIEFYDVTHVKNMKMWFVFKLQCPAFIIAMLLPWVGAAWLARFMSRLVFLKYFHLICVKCALLFNCFLWDEIMENLIYSYNVKFECLLCNNWFISLILPIKLKWGKLLISRLVVMSGFPCHWKILHANIVSTMNSMSSLTMQRSAIQPSLWRQLSSPSLYGVLFDLQYPVESFCQVELKPKLQTCHDAYVQFDQ